MAFIFALLKEEQYKRDNPETPSHHRDNTALLPETAEMIAQAKEV
jgi:hypothetical protein